jgi:hypothetical protein
MDDSHVIVQMSFAQTLQYIYIRNSRQTCDLSIVGQWRLGRQSTKVFSCWGKAHNMNTKVRKRVNKSVALLGEGPFYRHKS